MKIGLLAAMSCERKQIAALLDDRKEFELEGKEAVRGKIGGNELFLCESGIGKVNSTLTAAVLIAAFKPDVIVSTGCAGGIVNTLRVADVVVSARCAYHDVWCGKPNKIGQVMDMPPEYTGDALMLEKAIASECGGTSRVIPGLLVTGDQFIDTDEARERILKNFPDAIAVDMESAALAHVCYLRKIPFISFRVISDVPGADGNNTEVYENFWATMADKSFGITRKFLENLAQFK
jgi:adenosylhomocysteine nucleosidase